MSENTAESNRVDSPTLLLVEDDVSLAHWIIDYLSDNQYKVIHAVDGVQAVSVILKTSPAMVILDVMLPKKDGFQVCEEVRPHYDGPILMLTACNEDDDEIRGLELGANDFIGKPVRPKVLLARINALLRGNKTAIKKTEMIFGDLKIDVANKMVFLSEKELSLTVTEFDALCILAESAGSIVSRETLLQKLRGIDYDGFDRSVDITVSRLRKKLNDTDSDTHKIKTIRAKGYFFSPDVW